ncbi:uncharacterized protein V1510DRAFT_352676, partial [Dipodascopsis tothii]|uniref:uncharacterized protein n=1 Tax=Dipodascopsis tothii TaxID=44089 RepID=UPI0034CE1246
PFKASGVNGTAWTSEEKDVFFALLMRRGRHDPVGIARGMATKTVVQVQEYLTMLADAARGHELETMRRGGERARRQRKRVWAQLYRQMPAAREMSDEWVAMEEREGGALERHAHAVERAWEYSVAKRRRVDGGPEPQLAEFGGWVSRDCVAALESALAAAPRDEEAEVVRHTFGEPYQLLQVEQMHALADQLYYGPRRDLFSASRMDSLALQPAAVDVLFLVAKELTARLVRTALFVAQARLRASAGKVFHRAQWLTHADVAVACALVRAPTSPWSFWTEFKARNELVAVWKPDHARRTRFLDAAEVRAAL